MSSLSALCDSKGKVKTLVFTPSSVDHKHTVCALNGARPQKDDTIHFSPEPHFIGEVRQRFPGIELDATVLDWYDEYQTSLQQQSQIVASSHTNSTDFGSLLYNSELRPYQRAGIQWLNSHEDGAILGDPTGMGKTVQLLSVCELIQAKRVLVISPSYVKYQWGDQITRWLGITPVICEGETPKRRKQVQTFLSSDSRYLVVNIEMLRTYPNRYYDNKHAKAGQQAPCAIPELWQAQWDVVIVDEAHGIHDRNSLQSKGVKALKRKRLYLATGTPVWDMADDIWNLLHILEPKRFSSYWNFARMYCKIEKLWNGIEQVVGRREDRLDAFRETITPYVLARDKREFLPDLPLLIHKQWWYDASPKQRELTRTLKKKMRLELTSGDIKVFDSVASEISTLRMLLSAPEMVGVDIETPKDSLMMSLLADLLLETDRVLIACWFKDHAKHIAQLCAKEGIAHTVVDGDLSQSQRRTEIQRFRQGKVAVLIGTIASFGQGIDMQECNHCIVADADWTPTVMTQLYGRLDRFGQQLPPVFHRLICRKSIEQAIYEVERDKGAQANEILALQAVYEHYLQLEDL